MRILLTNDDGYDAPGLAALYEAVRSLPDVEIDVIAPAVCQSAKGHSISEVFSSRKSPCEPMGDVLVVDGTPADCVRAALHLPGHPRPDWVIAGINHGSNLGVDVYYSGTVAAAREAAIHGIPAIALSQLVKSPIPEDWRYSSRLAAAVTVAICAPDLAPPPDADPEIHRLAQAAIRNAPLSVVPISIDQPVAPVRPLIEGSHVRRRTCTFWNVNLPRPPKDHPPLGVRIAPLSCDPPAFSYRCDPSDGHAVSMTYVGRYHDRTATPGTDVALTFEGYITLSQLTLG